MALFTVTNLNDSGAGSLRQAIIDANANSDNDTIQFAAGLTGGSVSGVDDGTIVLGGSALTITNDLTINGDVDGDGRADITISGNDTSQVLVISGDTTDATLRSLDIADGAGDNGGAIQSGRVGSLALVNSTVRDSTAEGFGGGISAENIQIANSTLSGNTATYGGGLAVTAETARLDNVTLSGNTASLGGGIFLGKAVLYLNSSTITANTGTTDVGGLFGDDGSTAFLNNSILSGNIGDDFADAAQDNSPDFITSAASILGDQVNIDIDLGDNIVSDLPGLAALADNGGIVATHNLLLNSIAIGNGEDSLLPQDLLDVNNDGNTTEALPIDANGVVRVEGNMDIGAVESLASLTVDTLVDEDDGDYSAGDLSLREAISLVTAGGTINFAASITGGTTAGVDDGQIVLGGSQLIIRKDMTINGDVDGDLAADISISGNNASRVFLINGYLADTADDVTLRSLDIANGNSGNSSGGGIFGFYTNSLSIVNSTIRDSTTASNGGGISSYNVSGSNSLTIVNSTIENNTASTGGGVYLTRATATFDNTTISGNSAFAGGGIYASSGGQVIARNSTITQNTASYEGGITSLGSVSLANSILAGNTETGAGIDADTNETVTAQNSILGTMVSIGTNNGGNIISDTTGVAALADNGGPVETHALTSNSLAISAGDANLLAADVLDMDNDGNTTELLPFDADGNVRVSGSGGLDIGAVEVDDSLVPDPIIVRDSGGLFTGDFVSIVDALANSSAGDSITVSPSYGPTFEAIDVDQDDQTFILHDAFSAILQMQENGILNLSVDGGASASLRGNAEDNTLTGGVGNDRFEGYAGADTIDGGGGENALSYSASDALVVINLNNGAAIGGHAQGDSYSNIQNVFGSDHDDRLTGDAAANIIVGNDGGDLIAGLGGADALEGRIGADSISGGDGNDTMDGGTGDDRLFGGNDNDVIMGGTGNDLTNGGGGDDTILGGEDDDDVLVGGSGNDSIDGGSGNDGINGSFDDDILFGGIGEDRLFGGTGNDTLSGGQDNDTLGGLGDNDEMNGGGGDDGMNGGGGSDLLMGDAGEDRLFGGTDNDTLNGGADDDLLVGQLGTDTFVFDAGWGNDQISRYGEVTAGSTSTDEVIDMSSLGITFADLTVETFGSGTRIFITADGATDNSIEVLFRPVSQITESDFFLG